MPAVRVLAHVSGNRYTSRAAFARAGALTRILSLDAVSELPAGSLALQMPTQTVSRDDLIKYAGQFYRVEAVSPRAPTFKTADVLCVPREGQPQVAAFLTDSEGNRLTTEAGEELVTFA